MAKVQQKPKRKGAHRLKVKKQPLKDLEARKGVKGGARKRPGAGIIPFG